MTEIRNDASLRGRDFYDIYTILKTKQDSIDSTLLKQALAETAAKRESSRLMAEYEEHLESTRSSAAVKNVWERYAASTPYAEGITFDEVINAALELGAMAI